MKTGGENSRYYSQRERDDGDDGDDDDDNNGDDDDGDDDNDNDIISFKDKNLSTKLLYFTHLSQMT